jgi:hypothetical protein
MDKCIRLWDTTLTPPRCAHTLGPPKIGHAPHGRHNPGPNESDNLRCHERGVSCLAFSALHRHLFSGGNPTPLPHTHPNSIATPPPPPHPLLVATWQASTTRSSCGTLSLSASSARCACTPRPLSPSRPCSAHRWSSQPIARASTAFGIAAHSRARRSSSSLCRRVRRAAMTAERTVGEQGRVCARVGRGERVERQVCASCVAACA